MRKNILLPVLLLLCAIALKAAPAYPGRIIYTQPDGTTIGIRLHGDEFGHWITDDAGNLLTKDEEGYLRVAGSQASLELSAIRERSSVRRAAANRIRMSVKPSGPSGNIGSPRIPVILIGFKDKPFSKTNADFDRMLNERGYSDNGAVGSVYDYFNDNSLGRFTPQFEVLGPVTVNNNVSYYGENDRNGDDKYPEMALVHAARKLDATVDFSRYDNNGDGVVDFVLFYYAGYDEAWGADEDCIWSHAWYLSASSSAMNDRTFDGVRLDGYFCTSELKGTTGNTMCSVGTTCHEFSHPLGLPDFYDTNYGTNGSAAEMYDFDLMASGAYNEDGTMPPYYTAEELCEVGWLREIPELPASGPVTLPAINRPGAATYSAYMSNADADGEYFVYEVRGGLGWDASLPQGMLVYHVDKSDNTVYGSVRAYQTWENNDVNRYSRHPCCYVVPAASPSSTSYYDGSASQMLFPASLSQSYSPVAWSGSRIGYTLSGITYSNAAVSFNLTNTNTSVISGRVSDSAGNPLAGAGVSVTGDGMEPAALTTDSDGGYSVELPFGKYRVSVSRSGYISRSATVSLGSAPASMDFRLMQDGEAPTVLYAWPEGLLEESDAHVVSIVSPYTTAQNLYTGTQLANCAGKEIQAISFYLHGDPGSTAYEGVNVIIDYGLTRKATVEVSAEDLVVGGYTTVDLRDRELFIEEGRDLYAGVGYKSGGYYQNGVCYAFAAFNMCENGETADWAVGWPNSGWVSEYNLNGTAGRTREDRIYDFKLAIGDFTPADPGYNYIACSGEGVYGGDVVGGVSSGVICSAGTTIALTLVETTGERKPGSAISWYLDDELISCGSGISVTLSPGTHIAEARFTTSSGKTKVVELEIFAE